jgi:NADH-quinone oxidoreductase subunit M
MVAMVQPQIKRLIAYSSVAHMGYIVMGLFALNIQGLYGSWIQMINHAIVTGALFLVVGMIYERTHTQEISDYGGVAHTMPKFAVI